MSLPEIKNVTVLPVPFPTRWQAVIFRNYGLVSTENIARAIGTDRETVEQEALRLGLDGIDYDPNWFSRGYASIVRANWHLLEYSDLQTLLGVSEEELAFSLKEDDFLDVKLGCFKPDVKTPRYAPLTGEEEAITEEIGKWVKANRLPRETRYFDFYEKGVSPKQSVSQCGGERIVYSYAAPYGDIFLNGDFSGYSDELLAKLQKAGVNGVWTQGLLSQLSPYPFSPKLSAGYEIRRNNLKKLIERLNKFGIKLYLYFNEPRCLSIDDIPQGLKGSSDGKYGALCSSKQETWDYLYDATFDLMKEIPDLGGIMTITMSENLTHCKSKYVCNCENCKNVGAEMFASKVNNVILKATREAGSQAEIIANLWGWDHFLKWTPQQVVRGIELLDKDVSVLCVSETEMKLCRGGVDVTVGDYTLAGRESERTKTCFETAKKTGHRILAKIQVNSSWECSAVPYIPVFDLFVRHIKELQADGVSGYMLSWTVGGYPSLGLSLASELIKNPSLDITQWYEKTFGTQSDEVQQSVKFFCEAFEELPFHVMSIYQGNFQMGAGNFWYKDETGLEATMVGYPYDDIQRWKGAYPLETFISQLQKLSDGFERGVKILEKLQQTPEVKEILTMAKVCQIHFRSTLLQTWFTIKRKDEKANKAEILALIEEETRLVKELYAITQADARIGFEASNHYYYYENSLLEKLLNLETLKEAFEGVGRC